MIELSQLLAVQSARVVRQGPRRFRAIVINSKDARSGDLFFALPGERRDGHDFVTQAVAAGAVGAVVSKEVDVPRGTTLIKVPDTVQTLQDLGSAVRDKSHATVVAVTGSAGKTTTKDMIAHILGGRFHTLKSPASYNNHLGVPLTLLGLGPEHSHVVTEVGTNNAGEIDNLARLIAPDVGVITNVGFAHIGNFGSRDAIAAEKVSLLHHVQPGGKCVINGDDERLFPAAQRRSATGEHVVCVGFGDQNHLRAHHVHCDETGTTGLVSYEGQTHRFFLRAAGKHFVYALLLALAVGLEAGVGIDEAIRSLETFNSTRGRSNISRLRPGLLVIDDSHNASPDAMFAALDLLGTLPSPVKVAVLGEMRELGDKSPQLHRLLGRRLAMVATHLVTVGSGGWEAQSAAHAEGLDQSRICSAESARHALDITEGITVDTVEDCAVLVKGARFTHMERVGLGLGGVPVKCNLATCSLFINCRNCPELERS